MQLLPMNTPAEIHRWVETGGKRRTSRSDVTVARGPLVIMAYGLMSIDPAERESFWIHSPLGDLTPEEAEETLRNWSASH